MGGGVGWGGGVFGGGVGVPYFKEFKFVYLGILSLNGNPHISTLLQSNVTRIKTVYLNSSY